ncbi:hypothetical protein C8J56DRAFT_1053071 [Mycena floridula]|nr:hypothetical protein C8J56DRAFT_1053071 [Mycena floridula]
MDYNMLLTSLDEAGRNALRAALNNHPPLASEPQQQPQPAISQRRPLPDPRPLPQDLQPPPITTYQSPQPSPTAVLANMAAAVPSFNGMQTFGISVPAASGIPNPGPINVNIGHLTSASRMPSSSQSQPPTATFPDMNPPVPSCGRRHGRSTAARNQPRLMEQVTSSAPRPAAEMNCLFQFGDQIFVKVAIHVYPNRPSNCDLDDLHTWEHQNDIVCHQELGAAVEAFSESMGLRYQYQLPIDT